MAATQVLEALIRGRNESKQAFDEVKRQTEAVTAAQKQMSEAAAIGKRLSEQFGDALSDQAAVERIVADEARKLAAEMKNGAESVKTIGTSAKETNSHLDNLGHAFASGLGVGAFLTVAGALEQTLHGIKEIVVESIKGTADYAEKHELAALKLGMTTDATQRFSVAANINRSSLEQLSQAVVMMERNVTDGTPKAVAAMEKLGLTADIFKDPEQALLAVSSALKQIPEPAERASIAMGLLGRGGGNALPLLLQDLEAIGDRAERLGIVMGEDDVKAAAALNQESELLHETWDGLLRNFGLVFDASGEVGSGLKNIADTVGDLSQAVKEARPFLQDYYGLLARLAGFTQLGQSLAILRQFRDNLKEIFDQRDPLHATARLVAPEDSNYFKETLAEQRAYLTAVMENQRIEEQQAKRHESELAKLDRERDAQIKANTAAFIHDVRIRTQAEKEKDALIKANTAAFIHDVRLRAQVDRDAQQQEEALHRLRVNSLQIELQERQEYWRRIREAFQRHVDEMGEIANLVGTIGQTIGGAWGEAIDGAARVFENFLGRVKDGFFDIIEMAQTVVELYQGGYSTGRSIGKKGGSAGKGALAGAAQGGATGAAIGTMIMPGWGTAIGAGVGAIAGGIGGFLGAKKGAKELQAQMEEMRKQLLQTYGSMAELRKQASLLGVDIKRAFSTKDPQEFQRIIDQLNQATADQKKRWEGLQTALQGLDLMVKGFTASLKNHGVTSGAAWEAAQEKLARYKQKLIDAGLGEEEITEKMNKRRRELTSGIAETTEAQQAAFKRLGDYAAAVFGQMLLETGNVIGALREMEPILDQLSTLMNEFHLEGSKALQELLGLRQIVIDNEDVAQTIEGLNLLMKGLIASGIQASALFQGFGTDLASAFQTLVDRGVPANQALILMQPSLQALWEHQQRFHDITDEATLALLHEAEVNGLVGENMRSVNDKILQVLLAIAKVLGATIPDALKNLPTEKTIHVRVRKDDPNNVLGGGGGDGDGGGDDSGGDGDQPDRSFASGFGRSGWRGGPGLIRGNQLWQVHDGEMGWVIPRGEWQRMGFRSYAGGFGRGGDGEGRERLGGGGDAGSGNLIGSGTTTTSASGTTATTEEVSASEARINQKLDQIVSALSSVAEKPSTVVNVNSSPKISFEDKSPVRTREGVEALVNIMLPAFDRALRLNTNGLATRVRNIANGDL
jgi:molecular chaperone GrpE (heat shock protein)